GRTFEEALPVPGIMSDLRAVSAIADHMDVHLGGRAGVGLASMRERALELGGSCTVEARPEGGTLVRVVLPAYEEEEDAGDPDLAG
ncbi:hypothetical protein, partial [Streptosporangium sp. NPDC003464]